MHAASAMSWANKLPDLLLTLLVYDEHMCMHAAARGTCALLQQYTAVQATVSQGHSAQPIALWPRSSLPEHVLHRCTCLALSLMLSVPAVAPDADPTPSPVLRPAVC